MRVLSTILAAAVFSAAALLPPVCAAAGKIAAVSVFVNGDVTILRSGKTAYEPLKINVLLRDGDAIKTGQGATASIITKAGAEVRINGNTELNFPRKSGIRGLFDLAVGQVWSRMLHKMAALNVRTESAICAVRGTEADIEQRALMTVKVYEGHVLLKNALGEQALVAGQLSTVAGGAAPAAPRQMTDDEIGKWQETIEVKDLGKYLRRVGLNEKDLKVKISKDGEETDVVVKLKEKQAGK
jgi:hypothetical protein